MTTKPDKQKAIGKTIMIKVGLIIFGVLCLFGSWLVTFIKYEQYKKLYLREEDYIFKWASFYCEGKYIPEYRDDIKPYLTMDINEADKPTRVAVVCQGEPK